VVVKKGVHFRVVCRFGHERAAAEALQAAEAAWRIATEALGRPGTALVKPLDLHLYGDAESFLEAEKGLTGGKFARNLAFFHWETLSAHVALQPEVPAGTLDALGLPAQTRRLVAWECTHLARAAALPAFRRHPAWFVDGFAAQAAQEAMEAAGCAPAEEEPYPSEGLRKARALLEAKRLPPLEVLLADGEGDLEWAERYAARWSLVRYLRTGPRKALWAPLAKALGELPEREGNQDRLRRALEKASGVPLARLDADYREWLGGLRPAWEVVFRSLATSGEAWVQAAFPDTNAVAWRTEPAGKPPYAISGTLRILEGGRRQLNLLLGRTAGGFVSVAFAAGEGVTVLRYVSKGEEWKRVAFRGTDALEPGKPFAFRVAVDGDRVSVSVDGALLVEAASTGAPLDGPWGLGAQNGCCGVWGRPRIGN
jgi:hypothetical protein